MTHSLVLPSGSHFVVHDSLRKDPIRLPITPAEWRAAVDAANGALALDAAIKYGLVTGGPIVNVDRCVEILDAGRERGVVPSLDSVEEFAKALVLEELERRREVISDGSGARPAGAA